MQKQAKKKQRVGSPPPFTFAAAPAQPSAQDNPTAEIDEGVQLPLVDDNGPHASDDVHGMSTSFTRYSMHILIVLPGLAPPVPSGEPGDQPPAAAASGAPEIGDIKIEYHPHSKLPPAIMHFDDYLQSLNQESGEDLDHEPWALFGTQDNFEFAEWALEAELNQGQVETILKIIGRVRDGISKLNITSYEKLAATWRVASVAHPQVNMSRSFAA